MSELAVWMYGQRVGDLTRSRGRLSFRYTPGLELGAPLVSVAMPVLSTPWRGSVVHAFFNGLLPEGEARRMLAYDFGQIDPADVMGMLAALGRDCAGALVILEGDEEPPANGEPEPIEEADIAERLRRLRIEPLGAGGRVRVSLAGMQAKLLLAKTPDGWALPVDGAPSTHILKPATPMLADSVRIEGYCLRVAAELGLEVAHCEVSSFDGIEVLVVERYDRVPHDGATERVHQEDLCQASGVEPEAKYEARGGPGLRACARVLREWSDPAELWRLLDLTVLNVALGNPDAHAKNFALLHERSGRVRLSPAYDIIATLHDPRVSTEAGMSVNGQSDISRITRGDLVAEGASWGLAAERCQERVDDLLDRLPGARDRAGRALRPSPEALAAIRDQTRRLTVSS
ncbi:MAG: HipA domain-containing protein [Thermoleophilia bacterium]